MKCPYCRENNLIDAKFCAECGKPLSGDIPSYMLSDEKDLMEQAKDFFKEIEKSVTEKNYKEILSDRANPVTNMVITLAAWLALRTIGIIPFIILVRILAFLMGYPGLLFLMAMTYVYSTHQEEIRKKVDEIKGIDYRSTLREVVASITSADNGSKEDSTVSPSEEDDDSTDPRN